jgi:hypothetical protein
MTCFGWRQHAPAEMHVRGHLQYPQTQNHDRSVNNRCAGRDRRDGGLRGGGGAAARGPVRATMPALHGGALAARALGAEQRDGVAAAYGGLATAYGGRAAALCTAIFKSKARAPVPRRLLREAVVTARRLGANSASSSVLAVAQRNTINVSSQGWPACAGRLRESIASAAVNRVVPKRTGALQAFSEAWGKGGGVLALFRAAPVHIAPLASFEGAGDALAAVEGRSVGTAAAATHGARRAERWRGAARPFRCRRAP